MHQPSDVPPNHAPGASPAPPTRPPQQRAGAGSDTSPWPLVVSCAGLVIPPLGLIGGVLGVRQFNRAASTPERGSGIAAMIVGFLGTLVSLVLYLWFAFIIMSGMSGARSGFESARSARATAELSTMSGLLSIAELKRGEAPLHPLFMMLGGDTGEAHQLERILLRLAQDADVPEEALSLRGVSLIGVGRVEGSADALRAALDAQLKADAAIGDGMTSFSIFGVVHPDLDLTVPGLVRFWYARREGALAIVLLTGGDVRHVDEAEWAELLEADAALRREHGLRELPPLPMDPRDRSPQ